MLFTKNQLDDTKQSLKSLEDHTNIPYKLIVVDNASSDNTVTYLTTNGYAVIANKEDTDGTVRLNQGLRYLLADPSVEYIGFIHNDMLYYPKWLERLLDHLNRTSLIGKLSPESLHEYGNHPDFPDDPEFPERFMAQNQNIYYPANACPWIMPRKVVEEVGLFDEGFIRVGGYEDWDYNNRILQKGYQVMITRGSAVWHPMNGTRSKYDESEATRINQGYYYYKWGTFKEIVANSPGLLVHLSDKISFPSSN